MNAASVGEGFLAWSWVVTCGFTFKNNEVRP